MKWLVLLILLIPVNADAFDVLFKNTTDKTLIYRFAWVDHDFPGHFGPVEMAVGELKPGEISRIKTDYPAGIYWITWETTQSDNRQTKTYLHKTKESGGTLICHSYEKPLQIVLMLPKFED